MNYTNCINCTIKSLVLHHSVQCTLFYIIQCNVHHFTPFSAMCTVLNHSVQCALFYTIQCNLHLFRTRLNPRFYSGESNEFTGPNFTEVLRDLQLVESDVSVLGLPSPLSVCGLGVLRCLDESLAASSGCGQLLLLGRL